MRGRLLGGGKEPVLLLGLCGQGSSPGQQYLLCLGQLWRAGMYTCCSNMGGSGGPGGERSVAAPLTLRQSVPSARAAQERDEEVHLTKKGSS